MFTMHERHVLGSRDQDLQVLSGALLLLRQRRHLLQLRGGFLRSRRQVQAHQNCSLQLHDERRAMLHLPGRFLLKGWQVCRLPLQLLYLWRTNRSRLPELRRHQNSHLRGTKLRCHLTFTSPIWQTKVSRRSSDATQHANLRVSTFELEL